MFPLCREAAALAYSRHGTELCGAGDHAAALPLLQEAEALTLPAVSPARSFNLGVTLVALDRGSEAQKVRFVPGGAEVCVCRYCSECCGPCCRCCCSRCCCKRQLLNFG